MSFFIIGHTGFIGSSVTQILRERGHLVQGGSTAEFNLLERQGLSDKAECLNHRVVVMAAAIPRLQSDTVETMNANIQMTCHFCDILAHSMPKQVIYLSSVDVYGRDNVTLPLTEISPLMPSSFYGTAKVSAEMMLAQACRQFAVPFSILRLPGVYGMGAPSQSPIQLFADSILNRKTITVLGDGSIQRDFLYVNDLADVIMMLSQGKHTGTYNMVSGKSYSLNEIISMIAELSSMIPLVNYQPSNLSSSFVFKSSAFCDLYQDYQFTNTYNGLSSMLTQMKGSTHANQ